MRYNVVTIERQYGSGGRQIGEMLADRWSVPLYDRVILEETAANLSSDPEKISKIEESGTTSLLYSLVMAGQLLDVKKAALSPGEKVFQESSRIIQAAANRGPCVIVGRAAGYVLRDRPHCLRVFIYASREDRLRRCIDVYGHSRQEAIAMMKKYDRSRADFYRSVADYDWDAKEGYALMLNSSELGIVGCVNVIDEISQFTRILDA